MKPLSRDMRERLPETAPALFFIDIQPDQVEAFDRIVRQSPGVDRLERVHVGLKLLEML